MLSTKSAPTAPEMVAATLAFRDEPSTVTALIRASPIINAAAVAAVRRGLRTAFSRPSRPGSRREKIRPTPAVIGRLTSGESIAMPMKASSVPRPSSWMPPSRSDLVMAAAPSTSTMLPMIVCRFSERSGVAASRSAASGDTRLALRAGMIAATTVTMVPTMNDAMTVRVATTVGASGSCAPKTPNNALRPSATPTPASRPISELSNPTMTASRMTARFT